MNKLLTRPFPVGTFTASDCRLWPSCRVCRRCHRLLRLCPTFQVTVVHFNFFFLIIFLLFFPFISDWILHRHSCSGPSSPLFCSHFLFVASLSLLPFFFFVVLVLVLVVCSEVLRLAPFSLRDFCKAMQPTDPPSTLDPLLVEGWNGNPIH